MTEFTIQGNLENVNKDKYEFYLREGRNLYTIHATKDSGLIESLNELSLDSKIKVTGIILKDDLGFDIFVCRKATMLLGNDSSIMFGNPK